MRPGARANPHESSTPLVPPRTSSPEEQRPLDRLCVRVGSRWGNLGRVEVEIGREGDVHATTLFRDQLVEGSAQVASEVAGALIDACHRALLETCWKRRVQPAPCDPVYSIEICAQGERVLEARLPRRQIAHHAVLEAVLRRLHEAANGLPSSYERAPFAHHPLGPSGDRAPVQVDGSVDLQTGAQAALRPR
jgi:hypothetical protein